MAGILDNHQVVSTQKLILCHLVI